MDILIRGMEMPKKQVCVILNPNGLVEVLDVNNVLLEEYQAIPIPLHGDLIERDALKRNWKPLDAFGKIAEMQYNLDLAPTIIPADKNMNIQKEFLQNWHEEGDG